MILIKPTEVIDYAFLPRENIKPCSIKELKIDIAQQQYILPRFGDEMFESMLEGELTDFVDGYIKPALAFFVRASIIDDLSIQVRDDGAVVFDYNLLSSSTSNKEQQTSDNSTVEREGEEGSNGSQTENSNSEKTMVYDTTTGEMTYQEIEIANFPVDRHDRLFEGVNSETLEVEKTKTSTDAKQINSTVESSQSGSQTNLQNDSSELSRLRAATNVERRILSSRALSDANILIAKAVRYVQKNIDIFPTYQKQSLSSRMFF